MKTLYFLLFVTLISLNGCSSKDNQSKDLQTVIDQTEPQNESQTTF